MSLGSRRWNFPNYRWRQEFGGLKVSQAKRLRELELQNSRLKLIIAELAFANHLLKDQADTRD
jgi:putative transposase